MTKESIILKNLKEKEVFETKKIALEFATTLQEIEEYIDAAKNLVKLGKMKAIGKKKFILMPTAKSKTRIEKIINNAIRKGTSVTLTGAKVDGTLYKNEVLFPQEVKGIDDKKIVIVKKSDGSGWRSYRTNLIITAS